MGRHDHCRDCLCREFNAHGECNATTEQVVPSARSDGEPRLDLVVAGSGGVRARLDVAVTHALNVASMRNGAAARRDGVAATLMENHKRASYPGIRVTPAVVETHGRLGKMLLAFIRSS